MQSEQGINSAEQGIQIARTPENRDLRGFARGVPRDGSIDTHHALAAHGN
jgi:hypothetical protein